MGIGQWKPILQSIKLENYIENVCTLPREHEQLKGIREATIKKHGEMYIVDQAIMNTPVDEAQFLSMFLKLMNAKRTLEIGVFTGYSLLITALALPDDGHVTAIDVSKEDYEIGLPFIKNANVEHKITFIHSDANLAIEELLLKVRNGTMKQFDFIFVDADKEGYKTYHEKSLELVRVGGVIAYDDTLWFGYVADEDESELEEWSKPDTKALKELNLYLASDPRVETALLSIGGGLTLCRRLI